MDIHVFPILIPPPTSLHIVLKKGNWDGKKPQKLLLFLALNLW